MERKILFRGFHPDENGKMVITLDGEKIRGEWVYGSLLEYKPTFANSVERTIVYHNGSGFCYDKVFPETVGQWVTTDKNGKDVFEGDIVRMWFKDGDFLNDNEVKYDEEQCMYFMQNITTGDGTEFGFSKLELIGNIFESEVQE